MCILLLSELWEKEWAHINSLHLSQHITSIVGLQIKIRQKAIIFLDHVKNFQGKRVRYSKGVDFFLPLSDCLISLELSIRFLNIPIS